MWCMNNIYYCINSMLSVSCVMECGVVSNLLWSRQCHEIAFVEP